MKTVIDQMNRQVAVPEHPQRIISLVPSQTELLFYLGLTIEVIGITKFCIHPAEQFRSKTRIGGTKQFHFDKIAALQPDLIIGNKEENEQSQIEQLATQYPVWMSDIKTLDDALDMIGQIGKLIGKSTAANLLVDTLRQQFNTFPIKEKYRAAYFIWRQPLMVCAGDTFVHEMLRLAGFENAYIHRSRYPETSADELRQLNPQVILLSSEPYPFKAQHIEEFRAICPDAQVMVVDGELFSWYGNRLLKSVEYFGQLRESIATNT